RFVRWKWRFYWVLLDVGGRPRTWSWRREWDSNPRYGFPYTRFPSVRLKPLGHPSFDAPVNITLRAPSEKPARTLAAPAAAEPLSPGSAITYINRTGACQKTTIAPGPTRSIRG